jgi:hypothetical protein
MAKIGRPIALPGPLGDLAHKLGGVGPLAEEVGVSARTVRRWAHGDPMLPMARKVLTRLFKKHGVNSSCLFDPDPEP